MKKKEDRATFFLSLGVTLAVLITTLGCITVDYHGRRLNLGDAAPPVHFVALPEDRTQMEVKLFGLDKTLDVTGLAHAWEIFKDFLCLPTAGVPTASVPTAGVHGDGAE